MRDKFDIVVACDLNRGIGKQNALPWRLSTDMKYFKDLTSSTPLLTEGKRNAVIMGRKTWESIPPNFRPLKERYNLVLTRNPNYSVPQGVFRSPSLDEALEFLSGGPVDRVFVIGGAEVYKQALAHDKCGLLYLTEIRAQFDCDTFLPEFRGFFQLLSCSEVMQENDLNFCFKVYEFNYPEYLSSAEG
ncbi:MAG: dihydrofolate reductase [Candidatus Obscuribacter sp.]|nr:dihydrofolate reductase [Candidatus Melainabacteria bacterium]MDX1985236.1 dihydrofolate reductase [Candidatus Obscuribacter sp.]